MSDEKENPDMETNVQPSSLAGIASAAESKKAPGNNALGVGLEDGGLPVSETRSR